MPAAPSKVQPSVPLPSKSAAVVTPILTTSTAKPILRAAPTSTNQPSLVNKSPTVVTTHKPMTRTDSSKLAVKDELKRMKSIFYMESLQQKRQVEHKQRLEHLGRINTHRCAACPIYGRDLIEAVTMIKDVRPCTKGRPWGGMGYVHCLNAPYSKDSPRQHWYFTRTLVKLIHTPQSLLEELEDIISRFVFVIPVVTAPRIQMHMSHPPPSKAESMASMERQLQQELSPLCSMLHDIMRNTCTQFPELRLIQYDCGKLQTLDKLLWKLKSEGHRALIFTQMTRMLDVLEQFLNYHGHTYLRLDGNTRVDQRQALMERFNADKRIFCFILSTRSGGIGVNLTGADTVIFYDSDWNPTMDAQAQDRCHRIGQTRDVHIYRLISERTVEENILKKANQKRLLGDLAIEGGNFTTAFFKTNAIQELFGLEVSDKSSGMIKGEEAASSCEDTLSKGADVETYSSAQLEQALGMAEEENDIIAARTARAEAAAELAEFDETVPLDTDSKDMEEKSPAEEELEKLMEQLTPVEKYAMQFLESIQEPFSLEQLKQAEEEIEAQKKDWELGHLKALKEEEERLSALLEDQEEPLLCYSREDAYNQVYISLNGREQMPIWAPPTPPQDENDVYVDYSICFLYETSIMAESQLPPVYVKKETKRLKVDNTAAAATRKQKIRKEETVHVPRSLFDRPTAAILKMRREVKLQRVKGLMVGSSAFPKHLGLTVSGLKPPVMVTRPAVENSQEVPEWLIYEDRAILQVVQEFQDLPLNLMVLSPAHIPNWDLVADVVNLYSRAYRSQKLCRQRYELTIVPREEGKILYDTNPKKQKKSKGIYKTKNNKPMKTSQLLVQDKNRVFNEVYMRRFEAIKSIANKRTPTLKPMFVTPTTGKNLKHIAVLAEAGINYDQPLTPVQVAAIRAERIAREKQKSQAVAAAAAAAAEQQLAAQRQQQQQQVQVAAVQSAGAAGLTQQQAAQAVIASLAQSQQLQAVHASQLTKAALQSGAVTSVSLAKTLGSSIVVNTGGLTAAGAATAGTLASISKALGQVAGSGALAAQGTVQAATVTAMNAATLRAQRSAVTVAGTTSATMTVQEMVAAAATGQIRGLTTSVTAAGTVVSATSQPAVVSVAGLTPAQVQAATQRLSASTLAAAAAAGTAGGQVAGQTAVSRNLTPAQVQVFRQTALLRQQRLQEQQLKRLQVAAQQQGVQQAVGSGKVAVSVASALPANMAAAAAAQRTVQQQTATKQVAGKQAVARAMTEVEMAQLIKRQQLQQQQRQAVTQLTTAQLLAHAQLQQVQQQQQTQQSLAGTVQAPVATLVKTVSAPTSLGAAPSVTIPVSAVTMAGVNINVSLPQAKGNVASPKVTSTVAATAATVTQHQLRQLQLQQQILQQQRKAQLQQQQQKAAQMAQVQSKAPVTPLQTQIGTVQIVQQGGQMSATGQGATKGLPATATTMTVQQIQQVIKQVLPHHFPIVSAAAAASAQGACATTVTPSISSATVSQAQLLPHAVLQAAAFSSATGKTQALATVTLAQAPMSSSPTSVSSTLVGVSTTGTLSVNPPLTSASPVVQARVIPVSQASTAVTHGQTQYSSKQAIQVVATGLQAQTPIRSVSEAGLVTGTLKQQAVAHATLGQPVVTSPMTTSTAALLKGGPAVVVSGQSQAAILQQVAPATSGLSAQQAVTLAVRAAAAAATQGQGTQPQIQIQVQQAGSTQSHHQAQIVAAAQQGTGQALLHAHSLQHQSQPSAVLSASLQPGSVPSSAIQSSTQTASTNLVPSMTSSLTVPQSAIEGSQFTVAGQLAATPQQGGGAAIVTATPASASTTAQVVQAAIQAAKQQQQQQQQQQQRQSPYTMRLRNSPKQ